MTTTDAPDPLRAQIEARLTAEIDELGERLDSVDLMTLAMVYCDVFDIANPSADILNERFIREIIAASQSNSDRATHNLPKMLELDQAIADLDNTDLDA